MEKYFYGELLARSIPELHVIRFLKRSPLVVTLTYEELAQPQVYE